MHQIQRTSEDPAAILAECEEVMQKIKHRLPCVVEALEISISCLKRLQDGNRRFQAHIDADDTLKKMMTVLNNGVEQ